MKKKVIIENNEHIINTSSAYEVSIKETPKQIKICVDYLCSNGSRIETSEGAVRVSAPRSYAEDEESSRSCYRRWLADQLHYILAHEEVGTYPAWIDRSEVHAWAKTNCTL